MQSLPKIQPRMTMSGKTRRAICILEPTATPIDKSILSLIATVTAVACSAALPTIGSRIRPTKVVETPPVSVRPSILETMNSEQNATRVVEIANVIRAPITEREGVSNSSSSSSSSASGFLNSVLALTPPPAAAAVPAPIAATPRFAAPSSILWDLRLGVFWLGALYMVA